MRGADGGYDLALAVLAFAGVEVRS